MLNVTGLVVELGGRRVLHDIGFEAGACGWLGLLGANGSGKTTLLRVLSGRLDPTAGSIRLGEEEMSAAPGRRAAAFGFAPPLESLPPSLFAGELLALVARARDAAVDSPSTLWRALEIESLLRTRLDAMSAGQTQRIALFTAFVGAPPVVLLDEPFNWLDPLAAFEAKASLRELARSSLVVSALHDAATLALQCDAGVMLSAGRVSARFTRPELAAGAADLAAFERRLIAHLRSSQASQATGSTP